MEATRQIKIKLRLILQLAIGLSMLVSSGITVNGMINSQIDNPTENSKNEITIVQTEDSENTKKEKKAVQVQPVTKSTKQSVQEYFADAPIMIDVARCESHFTQYNGDGTVLRGRVNSQDVGVMQINEKYHLSDSIKLGFNIYTLEGNMAYARHLYKTQGTRPWEYSSHCWNKSREVALNQ